MIVGGYRIYGKIGMYKDYPLGKYKIINIGLPNVYPPIAGFNTSELLSTSYYTSYSSIGIPEGIEIRKLIMNFSPGQVINDSETNYRIYIFGKYNRSLIFNTVYNSNNLSFDKDIHIELVKCNDPMVYPEFFNLHIFNPIEIGDSNGVGTLPQANIHMIIKDPGIKRIFFGDMDISYPTDVLNMATPVYQGYEFIEFTNISGDLSNVTVTFKVDQEINGYTMINLLFAPSSDNAIYSSEGVHVIVYTDIGSIQYDFGVHNYGLGNINRISSSHGHIFVGNMNYRGTSSAGAVALNGAKLYTSISADMYFMFGEVPSYIDKVSINLTLNNNGKFIVFPLSYIEYW